MADNKKHHISFGEANPDLISQWHLTKNGDMTPYDVSSGSTKKVWWICERGHEWLASVGHRHAGSGCPYCSGKMIRVGYNDFANAHPDLVSQWHPTKNGNLTPFGVSKASNKKVWWICSKGHEWQAPISRRVDGHGCPYCANRRVIVGYNDFAHEHPELMPTWDYERNVGIDPCNVLSKSDVAVWWKCELGHSYRTTVKHRSTGTSCPKCATKENAQRLISAHALEFGKRFRAVNRNHDKIDLLEEYSGIWKKIKCYCKVCGHIWSTTPANLLDGCGCPSCACMQTSFQEQFIYIALAQKLGESNVLSRVSNVIDMELDIFIPVWKFAIEIGAWYWHKDKLARDEAKLNLCRKRGIELLTIYDSCHASVKNLQLKNCLVYKKDLGTEDSFRSLKVIVRWIFRKHHSEHVFTSEEWELIAEKAFKASRRSEVDYQKRQRLSSGINSRQLTHDEFITRLKKHGCELSKVAVQGRYNGYDKRIMCRCKVCGTEWNPQARALMNGHGCPICARRIPRRQKKH